MRRPAAALILILAASLAVFAARPIVVCTTSIVGDVVARIAGDDADVLVLLPIGSDPHTFELVPQDLVLLGDASVIFLSGADLEARLEPMLAGSGRPLVRLSDGLELLPFDEPSEGHGAPMSVDPHVWFDPGNVVAWTASIEEELSTLIPEAAERFAARASNYRAELGELETWIEEAIAVLPPERRLLVTDHVVFAYFAARYGFTQVGVVFPGTASSDPSAREMAGLMDRIRTLGVPAIFTGEVVRSSLVEQIARDAGTRLVHVFTGSLGPPDGPAGSYLELIRYDVTAIVDALHTDD